MHARRITSLTWTILFFSPKFDDGQLSFFWTTRPLRRWFRALSSHAERHITRAAGRNKKRETDRVRSLVRSAAEITVTVSKRRTGELMGRSYVPTPERALNDCLLIGDLLETVARGRQLREQNAACFERCWRQLDCRQGALKSAACRQRCMPRFGQPDKMVKS